VRGGRAVAFCLRMIPGMKDFFSVSNHSLFVFLLSVAL